MPLDGCEPVCTDQALESDLSRGAEHSAAVGGQLARPLGDHDLTACRLIGHARR